MSRQLHNIEKSVQFKTTDPHLFYFVFYHRHIITCYMPMCSTLCYPAVLHQALEECIVITQISSYSEIATLHRHETSLQKMFPDEDTC